MSPVSTQVGVSYPPDALAVEVKNPLGRRTRWAEDERNPDNILSSLAIGDEIPGGYKDFGCVLNRNPQKTYADLIPYSDVKVYLPGGRVVWEGSLDKLPDVSGEKQSISPTGLGYQAMLEDDQAIQVGFINRDLSGTGEGSLQSKFDQSSISRAPMGAVAQVAQASVSNNYGVLFDFTGVEKKAAGTYPYCSQLWYGGGAEIGLVFVDSHMDGTTPWEIYAIIGKDDRFSFGGGQWLSANFSGTVLTEEAPVPTTGYLPQGSGGKYVLFYANYVGAGSEFQMTNLFYMGNITILGTHGLPFTGTWPNVGFTAVQMLTWLINNKTQLEANEALMDNDGYVIQQAWYGAPTGGGPIVKDLTKYGYYDWMVYNGKRFDYKKPGTYGKKWRSTVKEMELNETGVDSQRLWKTIKVQWTDKGTGAVYQAGPVGSGCRVTSSLLEITDPNHPAVQANRTRNDLLDIQAPVTETTAIELGQRFLEEASLIDYSGSAILKGYVMDDKGVFYPVSCVKSGDWIAPTDASNNGYRKIVNKQYQHTNRQSEIDLGAPASGMEALLERLNAALIPLGLAG